MAITPLLELDRTSPTFRSDLDTFFGSALPAFAGQANELAANLNAIAAGGAYAIPYVFEERWKVGGPSGGLLTFDAGADATTTTGVWVDTKSSAGKDLAGVLDELAASSSAVKGALRIQKMSDPQAFAVYRVTSVPVSSGSFRSFAATRIAGNSSIPFSYGDAVMLFFQRTGDKGDTGPAYAPKVMIVRDQKAAGVAAQSIPGNTWTARELNTVPINEITGASLANNEITLPAGTFWFEATVPGAQCGQFTCRLQDSTNNTLHDYGTAEFANNSSPGASASHIVAVIGNSAPRKFRIDQLQAITQNGGVGGTSAPNFYTQVKITKVA